MHLEGHQNPKTPKPQNPTSLINIQLHINMSKNYYNSDIDVNEFLMLGIDEACFFAEVRIGYGHLEHLVGERFGVVVFLHDSEDKVALSS